MASPHVAWRTAWTGDTRHRLYTQEDEAVHPTASSPFLGEDDRTRLGGHCEKVADWQRVAIVDGHLITGQHPVSAPAAAQEHITLLASVPGGG